MALRLVVWPRAVRRSPAGGDLRWALIKWLCQVSVGLKIHAESSSNGSSQLPPHKTSPLSSHHMAVLSGVLKGAVLTASLVSCAVAGALDAIVMTLEVKMLVNPVSLRDVEWTWTGLFFTQWYGLLGLRVQVFIEYTATDAFLYSSTPSPFGDRRDTPRWELMAGTAACCTQYIRHCPFLAPCSSHGHKAGPLTVRLTSHHHVLSQCGFKKQVRYIPERPGREPVSCVV